MANIFYMPFRPAYDSAGVSMPGAQAYFTQTGTNTKKPVYSNSGLTTQRTNPVQAGASGKFPTIYLDPAVTYRVRIYARGATVGVDSPLEEFDPYVPGLLDAGSLTPIADAAAASATAASNSAMAADASADAAANSATAAGLSATAAANSATSAGNSATAAAGSAAEAATDADTAAAAEAAILAALSGTSVSNVTMNASSRALLAVLDYSLGLPAFLTEAGREGMFKHYSGAAYAAETGRVLATDIATDTAQGIFVASAGGAWVRQFDGPFNVHWFGAVPDNVTDAHAAFVAAIAVAGALHNGGDTNYVPAGKVFIPAGRYYLSSTLNIHNTVHLFGEGAGQGLGKATQLRFPLNTAGIIMNSNATINYANTGGPATRTGGSILEGFAVYSGTAGALGGGAGYDRTANADGIVVRDKVTLRDISASFFARNGFAIWAGTDNNPIAGNANLWEMHSCHATGNGEHGLSVKGTDANAGICYNFNAIGNARWGIIDESFLGNSYYSPHAAANGLGDGATIIDAVVAYPAAGQRYAVAYGQETAAATTTPGTDASIWIPMVGATGGRTWVSGITVRSGGPYALRSTSRMFGQYSESGQGPMQNVAVATTFPAFDDSGIAGPGLSLQNEGGLLRLAGGLNGLKWNSRDTGVNWSAYNSLGKLRFNDGLADRLTISLNGNHVRLGNNAASLFDIETGGALVALSAGYGPPQVGVRSGGTRFVIWDGVKDGFADYALGTDDSTFWLSVPTSSQSFKFYGGATQVGSLSGTGNLSLSGSIKSAGGGVGYATGAGGTVTQLTSKSTGVILNKVTGQITTHNASLANNGNVRFQLTNSMVEATDTMTVCMASGGTGGAYVVWADQFASGSCYINIRNVSGGALGEALVLNFTLTKGQNS